MKTEAIVYNEDYTELIEHILKNSQYKMIESRESFDKIIDSIILFNNQISPNADPVQIRANMICYVFEVCCNFYPDVAMYILQNNMYSKESFFRLSYNMTLLEIIIKRNHYTLLDCLIEKLDFFDELLAYSGDNKSLPLIMLHDGNNGIHMFERILNSKHCTPEILKKVCKQTNRTVFEHWCFCGNRKLIEILLKSDKCTNDVIASSNRENRYPFLMSNNLFELVLNLGKPLPDYFDAEIFHSVNSSQLTIFLDSQYSNEEIIEKYFSNITDPSRKIRPSEGEYVRRILFHPKYSHLKEKYNTDGSIKLEYNQKIKMKNEAETRIEELVNIVEQLKLENELLQLQVTKYKLENEILQLQNADYKFKIEMALLKK